MRKICFIFGLLVAFGITSCEKEYFEPQGNDSAEAVLEQVNTIFLEYYPSFTIRNVNWSAQYNQAKQNLNSSNDKEVLHQTLLQLLTPLKDGHVALLSENRPAFHGNDKPDDGKFQPELIQNQYIQQELFVSKDKDTEYFYGLLANDIAYIHFKTVYGEWSVLKDLLTQKLPQNKGLIIDLRRNEGGDFTYGLSGLEYLTDQKTYVFRSKTKNGAGPEAFTPWFKWYVQGKRAYTNKIVLITDSYTFSAGERLTMAIRSLPNVVHIGEATSGSTASIMFKELNNGWFIGLPTQIVEDNLGINHEGKGIPPTIKVINSDAGKDLVLETALNQF
ncbi:S41 family peptidase [Adhaeribacter radiodurans]|uniref:S41 family peptidase n=1 Tax=Adhaeribacter radiodurans TaxID=2745197 RepID=A0A7L7LD89_9BACT|nr:S41 family peptidase [Adhaeribacter radiodurans]QMU30816.1 S41 family peptidase [Adhaeribacter radiodurans]